MKKTKIPILFDRWYEILSRALFLLPSASYVEVDDAEIRVRMGWAFRACFPGAAVVSVKEISEHPISRGVHGLAGKWLVNGSGRGIVAIDLTPPQRGFVMSFPVRLRHLMVSVKEPAALVAALYETHTL